MWCEKYSPDPAAPGSPGSRFQRAASSAVAARKCCVIMTCNYTYRAVGVGQCVSRALAETRREASSQCVSPPAREVEPLRRSLGARCSEDGALAVSRDDTQDVRCARSLQLRTSQPPRPSS
eukprot:5712408-Prymnesium_polylepis.1